MYAKAVRYNTLCLYTDPPKNLIKSADSSSSYYYVDPSQGDCPHCKDVTGSCVGHISYHKLRYCHLNPLYAEELSSLFACICNQCRKVNRNMPQKSSEARYTLYNKIHARIGETCTCTQAQTMAKWNTRDKVLYLQNMIGNEEHDYLQEVGLPPSYMLLCRYFVIIPYKVISVMVNATDAITAYEKLLKQYHSGKYDKEERALEEAHKAIADSITGKEGICRKFMVTVNMQRSCRGVIVSDPTLPINRLGTTPRLSRTLLSEVEVTDGNLEEVVSLVFKSRVQRIRCRGERYKLVSNMCFIVYIEQIPTYAEVGGTIQLEEGALQITEANVVEVWRKMQLSQTQYSGAYLAVECAVPGQQSRSAKVPLIVGSYVTISQNNTHVMVSRNPVMGADSLRRLVTQEVPGDTSVSLTMAEKYNSRIKAAELTQEVVGRGGTVDMRKAEYTRVSSLPTVGDGTVIFTLVNKVDSPVYGYSDNNATKSINPVITEGFNGDFDGDELNTATLEPGAVTDDNTSIVADMLRVKDGKPIYYPKHDGRYGLWVFVNNKGKLQSKLRDYVKILQEELKLAPSRKLPEVATSMRNRQQQKVTAEELGRQDYRIEYCTKVATEIKGVFTNKYVADFYISALVEGTEELLLSHIDFNRRVASMYSIYTEYEDFLSTYDCTCEDGLATLYSQVMLSAYAFCDSYGMYIGQDGIVAKEIVESGARTSVETYEAVYNSVGNVSYMLPGNKKYSTVVTNNYMNGVSLVDYVHLTIYNRMSLANKALNAAPAGDAMRHMCSYTTALSSDGDTWSLRGTKYYRSLVASTPEDEAMLLYATEPKMFTTDLNMTIRPYRYRPSAKVPQAVKDVLAPENHRGQLKLLLAELQFLTAYARGPTLLLYAGAASGSHLVPLLRLFPELTMHLYDTAPFCPTLQKHDRVKIFQQYLTRDVVAEKMYAKHENLLFCSDIRTATNTQGDIKVTEEDVENDNKLTLELVPLINARASMVKFRCPFKKGSTSTFAGSMKLQAWTTESSSEVRVWCERPYTTVQVRNSRYDDAMFSHNISRRCKCINTQVIPAMVNDLKAAGIAIGYDAVLHSHIIYEYCKVFDADPDEVYRMINSYSVTSVVV